MYGIVSREITIVRYSYASSQPCLCDVCRHASQSRTNQVLFVWHVQARNPEVDDSDIVLRDVCRHASQSRTTRFCLCGMCRHAVQRQTI